jgi:hypothetical protein
MPANGHFHEDSPSTALLIPPAPGALAVQYPPDVVLAEATKAAKALHDVIESKPSKCVINGKTYLQFEDWQTLGRFYGVTAKASSTKYVEFGEKDSYEQVRGFEATADALLVGTNQVISSAEAMCLDDESRWGDKPLFQLKSMAQTRACAKALRNVLAWVVVLAGYEGTPAEELDGAAQQTVITPRRKSEGKSAKSEGNSRRKPAGENSVISFMQQKELFDLAHQHGKTPQDVMRIIAKCGYEQPGEVTLKALIAIRKEIEGVQ